MFPPVWPSQPNQIRISYAYEAKTALSTSPKTLINKKAYLITKGI